MVDITKKIMESVNHPQAKDLWAFASPQAKDLWACKSPG